MTLVALDRKLAVPESVVAAPARPAVIAATAWEIPGLRPDQPLSRAFQSRAEQPLGALPVVECATLLRRVTHALLERAGLRELGCGAEPRGVVVGEGPAGWSAHRNSFAALLSAWQQIARDEVERILVAGLLRWRQPRQSAAAVSGVCAVLIESEAAWRARPHQWPCMRLAGYAAGRPGHDGHQGVLGLLDRHPGKPLYVPAGSALRPALSVVSRLLGSPVRELAEGLPPDPRCHCLLQLIDCCEQHPSDRVGRSGGVVLANDDALSDDPVGLIVVEAGNGPHQLH